MTIRVVLVEDEHLVRRVMAQGLRDAGFAVSEAADAFACRALLRHERPDAAVVDLGLPGVTGIELARELRAVHGLPVVIVSRRDEPDTMIDALELGCEDYLVKPVHPGVLAARVRGIVRRRSVSTSRVRRLGRWRVDLEARVAESADGSAELTRGEFDLLRELMRAEGKIVTRTDLIRVVSRNPDTADARTVDALVSRIRRKLPLAPGEGELIVAAPGFGYRLGVEARPE